MIYSLKDLMEFTVQAPDGPVGRVLDFFIDVKDWQVRYLVAEPENDLTPLPAVLLSTLSLGEPNPAERRFPVNVSREKIKNSPELDLRSPLNRQLEIELHDYYGWPFYWGPTTVSGMGPGNLMAAYPLIEMKEEAEGNPGAALDDDSRLRSAERMLSCQLRARDGEFGLVEDMLIESETWNVLYLVGNTGSWLTGRSVLLSPSWVLEVDWESSEVHFDLERSTIQNSPKYEPDLPLDSGYETQLKEYYHQQRK